MDARRINAFARKQLGFFFTTRAERDESAGEYAVFNAAVERLLEALREGEIRAPNVLERLPALGVLTENLGKHIKELADEHAVEHLQDLDAAFAYASALTFAAIGARNQMVENIRARRAEEEQRGGEWTKVQHRRG